MQPGPDAGDEDEKEWHRCQEEARARDVGMGYPEDDEERCHQEWSGIAEVASARPGGVDSNGQWDE